MSLDAPDAGGMPLERRLELQARLYAETLAAFVELPPHQRLAFATWGLADSKSWLRFQAGGDKADRPLPFDDALQPKPAFFAMAAGLQTG